jgi:hypothetical protein
MPVDKPYITPAADASVKKNHGQAAAIAQFALYALPMLSAATVKANSKATNQTIARHSVGWLTTCQSVSHL